MLSKKWRWIGVFCAAWSLEAFAENHPTMEISPTEEVEVAPDSPRASFRSYMDAVRRGNYRQASIFLDLREVSREDGPRLARNLKAVIDRKLNIDLEKLSPEATGFLQDSLPSHLEEVARIELEGNASAPIVMKRVRDENGARWVFTSNTVKNIERWYAELADKWALEHLPEPLLRSGPKDIRWWQWLGLLLLSVGAWALAGC